MDLILDLNYLEERFRIFQKYTIPSIKNQTSQNFQWIILFHKNTPREFKELIQKLKKEYEFIDLYFDDDEKFIFSDFVDKIRYSAKWFLTSRIDNDDMFDPEYIEQVQDYAQNNSREYFISFENGQKLDARTGIAYNFSRKDNHFLSLLAPKENMVLQYSHNKILESGKELVLLPSLRPMWIEIIHDTNVINDIKENDLLNIVKN